MKPAEESQARNACMTSILRLEAQRPYQAELCSLAALEPTMMRVKESRSQPQGRRAQCGESLIGTGGARSVPPSRNPGRERTARGQVKPARYAGRCTPGGDSALLRTMLVAMLI